MNRLLEGGQLFTSKQYLAKAVEYGDLAKTSVGSAKRQESKRSRVDTRCSQSLPIMMNCSKKKARFPALSRTRQIERPLRPRIMFSDVLELRLSCNGTHCQLSSKESCSTMPVTCGELLDTSALRGQIARFLHTHKNDENNGGAKERYK